MILAEVPTDGQMWSELFRTAAGTGLGGLLLLSIVYYLQKDNKSLLNELKTERTDRNVKVDADLKECRVDREKLQAQIIVLKDQMIDIYKSRHDRIMVERQQEIQQQK